MRDEVIEQTTIRVMTITPKTRWIFVELCTRSGMTGTGEATAQGKEDAVVRAFGAMANSLIDGKKPDALIDCLKRQALPDLTSSAVVSALDQAAWDLVAKAKDISVATALDREYRRQIRVYANINRRTTDRSPEGFAKSAAEAIAAGHEAIKIAPFDEATSDTRISGGLIEAVAPGLARMRAVRDEIGRERRLMIDCHWRLDRATAEYVIDAAAEAGLYWVECPLPEAEENLGSIKALRDYANRRGVKLAGCEEMIRLDGFMPFLVSGAYDVLMPDVKYVGGLQELLRIGGHATKAAIAISPHNPSGPVCHAASLQVCSALAQNNFLEMQFDEAPLFEQLQSPRLPAVEGGRITLPSGAGLGLELDRDLLERATRFEWNNKAIA